MDRVVIVIADPSGEGLGVPEAFGHRYECVVETRVEDVIEAVRSREPAAVVVDFPFPTAHGESLVRVLRRDPTTADAPIIAFSSWNYPRTRATAGEYGCASFVSHAQGPRQVVQAVERLAQQEQVA